MIRGLTSFLTAILLLAAVPASGQEPLPLDWTGELRRELLHLESIYPEKIGLFIKDLGSGRVFSHRGEQRWYVASGVKVPVALETYRQISEGTLSLSTRVRLRREDYVDGAGPTNWKKPGTSLTVRYLLDQMLIHSDNTATDLLLRTVGTAGVNDRVAELVPGDFGEITSLGEVRRLIYGGLHDRGRKLRAADLLALASIRNLEKRTSRLAKIIGTSERELRLPGVASAFAAYYASGVNTATLSGYGRLLELIAREQVMDPFHTELLLQTMTRVQTGRYRLKAGLPKRVRLAHKTGTQHLRVCDFGIAWIESAAPREGVVIAACIRDLPLKAAEQALERIAVALAGSGIFS